MSLLRSGYVGTSSLHELKGNLCDLCGKDADSEVSEVVALDCTFQLCPAEAAFYHQACLEKYLKSIKCERWGSRAASRGRARPPRSARCSASPLIAVHAPVQEPEDWLPVPARQRQRDRLLAALPRQGARACSLHRASTYAVAWKAMASHPGPACRPRRRSSRTRSRSGARQTRSGGRCALGLPHSCCWHAPPAGRPERTAPCTQAELEQLQRVAQDGNERKKNRDKDEPAKAAAVLKDKKGDTKQAAADAKAKQKRPSAIKAL